MQHLLVVIVQQHGKDGQLVFVLDQAAGQGCKALATFGLQLVTPAQAGFEQGGDTFRNHRFHIRVGWQRTLLKVYGVVSGDALEANFSALLVNEIATPLAPPARPVRPARWM